MKNGSINGGGVLLKCWIDFKKRLNLYKKKTMALIISDEILQDVKMTADEMRLNIAVWLFQIERISIGKASKLAGLSRFVFQKILAERDIPVIRYSINDIQDEL